MPPISAFFRPGELLRSIMTSDRAVMLSFDDGPDDTHTLAIADILAQRGYEGLATWFQVARSVRVNPQITRQLFERGYEIGNHSYSHTPYTGAGLAAQIEPAQTVLFELTGQPPIFFRSPGLVQSSLIQIECARLGMINIFTDGDERDWVSPRISSAQINANFTRYLHPGYISLRHDGGSHQNTVDATHGMLDVIESRGYKIISLRDGLVLREDRNVMAAAAHVDVGPADVSFDGQEIHDTADGTLETAP